MPLRSKKYNGTNVHILLHSGTNANEVARFHSNNQTQNGAEWNGAPPNRTLKPNPT
jgi:hypothetical protein